MKKFNIFLPVIIAFFLLSVPLSGFSEEKTPVQEITLEKSIKISLQNSLELQSAEKDIEKSEARISQARTGNYPSVQATVNYTRIDPLQTVEINNSQVAIGVANQATGIINMNYSLYDGGQTSNLIDQATLLTESVRYDRETTSQGVIYKAIQSYYNVLRQSSLLKVSEDALNKAQEHSKSSQAFYEEGLVPKVDVANAEAQVANAELDLIKARTAVENSKSVLKDTMNIPLDTQIDVVDTLTFKTFPADLNYITDLAYKNRPEIKKMEFLTDAAQKAIEVARSENRPDIIFNFNYFVFSSTTANASNSIAATLGATFPIFDRGLTKYKIEEAEAALEQAGIAMEQVKKGIALEVKQAYLNFLAANDSVDKIKAGLSAAEENYNITVLRYQEGIAPFTEVTDARLLLVQAETANVQALYDYFVAWANLVKTTGLLPEDGNLDIKLINNPAKEEGSSSLYELVNKK